MNIRTKLIGLCLGFFVVVQPVLAEPAPTQQVIDKTWLNVTVDITSAPYHGCSATPASDSPSAFNDYVIASSIANDRSGRR